MMNEIIELVNEIDVAQKKLMELLSSHMTKLETKIDRIEEDLEENIASIIDALDKFLDNDESFQSKVQNVIKSLTESEYLTNHPGSIIVGSSDVYALIKTFMKSMVETWAHRHPETDCSPIVNGKSNATCNPTFVSNLNKNQ